MNRLAIILCCFLVVLGAATAVVASESALADPFLDEVVSFCQPAACSSSGGIPDDALGMPDFRYLSIDCPVGQDGNCPPDPVSLCGDPQVREIVTFAFTDNIATDGPGSDLRIYEVQNGDSRVDIYASEDDVVYYLLAQGVSGTVEFDLADYDDLDFVVFVRFKGREDTGKAKGFDLDAVEALNPSY